MATRQTDKRQNRERKVGELLDLRDSVPPKAREKRYCSECKQGFCENEHAQDTGALMT